MVRIKQFMIVDIIVVKATIGHYFCFHLTTKYLKKYKSYVYSSLFQTNISTGHSMKYSEIIPTVKSMASALCKKGFQANDVVLIMASNYIEVPLMFYAAWKAGGSAACLTLNLPASTNCHFHFLIYIIFKKSKLTNFESLQVTFNNVPKVSIRCLCWLTSCVLAELQKLCSDWIASKKSLSSAVLIAALHSNSCCKMMVQVKWHNPSNLTQLYNQIESSFMVNSLSTILPFDNCSVSWWNITGCGRHVVVDVF